MKNRGVFRLLVLVVTVFISARAEVIKSYFLNGGNLTLRPAVDPPITSILWKYRGDLLAEWIENNVDLTYYGDFNGRTTLDINTGRLEISKMNETKDSGSYTLEINNKVHGQSYDAISITEVPKPKVWIRPVACDHSKSNCTLFCDGDTAKAEPVTYTWMMDDKNMIDTSREVKVFKTGTGGVRTFSCSMKNPVSEKSSDPKENPFFDEGSSGSSVGGVVAGVLIVLAVLAAGGVGFWQKDRIKARFSQSNSGNAAISASASNPENGTDTAAAGLMATVEDGKTDTPVSPPE